MLRIIALFITTLIFTLGFAVEICLAYAWIATKGVQNKRLSIIQETPIKLQYIDADYGTSSAKLYTDVTESKLNIGLANNVAFSYETVTWNMEDIIKQGIQPLDRHHYTVAQNKLSLATSISRGAWDSASLRLILQTGFYYPQARYYIQEAEAAGVAIAYGRTIPLAHTYKYYLYFETSLLHKLYPRLKHFERRLDMKLGLKILQDIELALGFYRIMGLVNIPRNMHMQTRQLLDEDALTSRWQFPYIASKALDRIYLKLGLALGTRKFDLDFVFGGERFLQARQSKRNNIAIHRQWNRVAIIFSYNLEV
ncbi:MAG: hypothetical protein JSS50_02020 [Proteobacteria bacterium]|nr:hypothetical protein [Pseudomonadota bacterium]